MEQSSVTSPIETDLRYPIGRFKRPVEITKDDLTQFIADIQALPSNLSTAVAGLSEGQIDTPYRPDGWTVRQVSHHLADSHLNSFYRYRVALTEDTPTISAYKEAAWAELPDAKTSSLDLSLELLRGLHARWVILLRSMTDEQFQKSFRHPERGEMRLDWVTGLYAWHCRHHVAHITSLRERENW